MISRLTVESCLLEGCTLRTPTVPLLSSDEKYHRLIILLGQYSALGESPALATHFPSPGLSSGKKGHEQS